MDKQELIAKIKRIDENVFFSGIAKGDRRFPVVIVGSGALLLRDLSSKGATKDVDVLRAEHEIAAQLYADPDFNNQCVAYEACLPYNYEDRLVKVALDTYVLDVLVPSIEDMAVMKLYRWEDPDKIDLTAPEFLDRLDWRKLDALVHSEDEAAASRCALPEDDREFKNLLRHYEEFEEGWKDA